MTVLPPAGRLRRTRSAWTRSAVDPDQTRQELERRVAELEERLAAEQAARAEAEARAGHLQHALALAATAGARRRPLRVRGRRPSVALVGTTLTLVDGAERHAFDVTSPAVSVVPLGVPGERGWVLQVHRPGLPPLALPGRLLDDGGLTATLAALRPELALRPAVNVPA